MTRLQAGLRITVRLSAETTDLSLFQSFQTGSGAHPASYSTVPRALSPGINHVELQMSVAIPKLPHIPSQCTHSFTFTI